MWLLFQIRFLQSKILIFREASYSHEFASFAFCFLFMQHISVRFTYIFNFIVNRLEYEYLNNCTRKCRARVMRTYTYVSIKINIDNQKCVARHRYNLSFTQKNNQYDSLHSCILQFCVMLVIPYYSTRYYCIYFYSLLSPLYFMDFTFTSSSFTILILSQLEEIHNSRDRMISANYSALNSSASRSLSLSILAACYYNPVQYLFIY